MNVRPAFKEKIATRTWPRSSNKLFAIRDYDIHYADDISEGKDGPCRDSVMVRGRSAWLVVDIERRRPLRPQIAVDSLPPNEGINALPGENQAGNDPPPSLAARDFSAIKPVPRKACYSDIDYNGHVNNTRYIQWIQDLVDKAVLEKAAQIRLDINYIAEVLYGETIDLFIAPIGKEELLQENSLNGQTPRQCSSAFAIEGRRGTGSGALPVFRAILKTG
jgi:acyl-ACP thioesterase